MWSLRHVRAPTGSSLSAFLTALDNWSIVILVVRDSRVETTGVLKPAGSPLGVLLGSGEPTVVIHGHIGKTCTPSTPTRGEFHAKTTGTASESGLIHPEWGAHVRVEMVRRQQPSHTLYRCCTAGK